MRTSTNGSTWTTVTSNFGNTAILSIAYGNNLWVAGGNAGQMRTSTNATTWTTVTSNFGNTAINSIAYGNNLWVAGGASGQMRTSNTNFINIYAKKVLAVGNNGLLLESFDNIDWTSIPTPTNKDINIIKYANERYFLAVDNE
jgi:hypothetical protein